METDNRLQGNTEFSNDENELKEYDRTFLHKFITLVETNIQDPSFDVGDIEGAMNVSHSTLYRRIKRLTGMTTREYIKSERLAHSIRLMQEGCKVIEAAEASGFKSPRYFRMCFREKFGILPSEFIRSKKRES